MPLSRTRRARRVARLLALTAVIALGLVTSPAYAAEGSIDHVEKKGDQVQILYSLPGVDNGTPDLSTLKVSLDGKPLEVTATLASDAKNAVRRTAILAIDVSDSMGANGKFDEAKKAADIFLQSVPADLYVGVVT